MSEEHNEVGWVSVLKSEYPSWVYDIHGTVKAGGRKFYGLSEQRLKNRMFIVDYLGDIGKEKADGLIEHFKHEFRGTNLWSGLSHERRKNLYVQKSCRCFYCRRIITLQEMTVEHVVPRGMGGADMDSNYEIACYQCNQEKSNELTDIIYRVDSLLSEKAVDIVRDLTKN